jgi:phosphohistidine phosphatase SixA
MRDWRRWTAVTIVVVSVVLTVVALTSPAAASDDLWALLKSGGQIVFIRHAITTPGVGDPPGMRLDDCRTQRNLTDDGRQHARRVGEAFRARGIAVTRVLSSPWCRCLETAQLAFGPPEVSSALGNLFGRPEAKAEQVRQMRAMAGVAPGIGNVVWVSHGSTIVELTGVNPDPAEMIILTPQGGGRFSVAGRLMVAGGPEMAPRPPTVRSIPAKP